jgi:hypothetical protein
MFSWQDQILIGTVLGGSSLVKPPKGKNCYLSMRDKNDIWLQYKMEAMSNYFKDPKLHNYGFSYRCNSSCCSKLTDLRNVLYKDGKRSISIEVLDPLQAVGLAIWYLDGGGKTGRGKKNAYLSTTKFGKNGSEVIREYFGFCGLNSKVNISGKDRWRVLFDVKSTQKFFQITAEHFPKFMWHRIVVPNV